MIEAARAEASRRGLTNIHFRQCSADELPFTDRAFDVAVGRLSAMFFVDSGTALREALRVILEDGIVGICRLGSEGGESILFNCRRRDRPVCGGSSRGFWCVRCIPVCRSR